jgi:hypothetical protein
MARKRPPQHRADVAGIYIPRSDSSFDQDRYDREVKRMKEEGLEINAHPIERYYAGKTRYDLDAQGELFGASVCARDYFDASKEPERWTLRRLDCVFRSTWAAVPLGPGRAFRTTWAGRSAATGWVGWRGGRCDSGVISGRRAWRAGCLSSPASRRPGGR